MVADIEMAIEKYKDKYGYDHIDEETFEKPSFVAKVKEALDEYEDDIPSDDAADIVKDALYFVQYGDTSDADDLAAISEDYCERFPEGSNKV